MSHAAFTSLRIAGGDAIRLLNEHRPRYPVTGLYPFLIGDVEELGRITEWAGLHEDDRAELVAASLEVDTARWAAWRRREAEEGGVR